MLFTVASFFFALAETALLSLGEWRLRQLAAEPGRAAGRVTRLLSDPAELVATLALGSTTANALLVTVVLLITLKGHWLNPLVMVVLLPVVLVGCEVVPKTLAVRAPVRWALRVAALIQIFHFVTRPLRKVAGIITSLAVKGLVPAGIRPTRQMTDDEYEELIELAFQQGTIARTEKDIILEIIRLDRRTVREVMRPRTQMVALSDELYVEEMIAEARKHGHRRLPLYDESPDTIVGILNVRKLLLDPAHDLAEAVEFPSFVPETMNLLMLLQSFQKQKRGLAVVLDEYGGTAGLVTLTDILRELLGEIRGEGEEATLRIERLGPRRWRVNGAVKVEDFREEHPALREHAEVNTLGGLLVSRLQIVPQAGQSIVVDGLRLTAEDVDERRVRILRVEAVQDHRGKGGAA
jgi:CBS domain containing-hemolysin-like protein